MIGHTMFKFVEQYGDIFMDCDPTIALAHTVSLDFHMRKGIAWTFREKFGQVHYLKGQVQAVGQCAFIKHESRWIFYMVTKQQYFLKPNYFTLEQALQAMRQHLERLHIETLAIPGYLACGRDKLDWGRVKQLIHKVFWDSNVTMYVYYL